MKTLNISRLHKQLPHNSGWTGSRSVFNGAPAIEYDSEGFGK